MKRTTRPTVSLRSLSSSSITLIERLLGKYELLVSSDCIRDECQTLEARESDYGFVKRSYDPFECERAYVGPGLGALPPGAGPACASKVLVACCDRQKDSHAIQKENGMKTIQLPLISVRCPAIGTMKRRRVGTVTFKTAEWFDVEKIEEANGLLTANIVGILKGLKCPEGVNRWYAHVSGGQEYEVTWIWNAWRLHATFGPALPTRFDPETRLLEALGRHVLTSTAPEKQFLLYDLVECDGVCGEHSVWRPHLAKARTPPPEHWDLRVGVLYPHFDNKLDAGGRVLGSIVEGQSRFPGWRGWDHTEWWVRPLEAYHLYNWGAYIIEGVVSVESFEPR